MPWLTVSVVLMLVVQLAPRVDGLVAAVRPLLPYPAAGADGDVPADSNVTSKWFVVWPSAADDTRIIVRANPLHPDVQRASAEAMEAINAAVTAAERRAQAAYDRAVEQLRKTGKAGDLEAVTLDDEGIAGERIDAELEVTIELAQAEPFEIASGEPPTVTAGTNGVSWTVAIPANAYRDAQGPDQREHFRAAETRLYFGLSARPVVVGVAGQPRYRVSFTPATASFAVVIRGNAGLVAHLAGDADWSRLAAH
jgi:hypothetical protein